MQCTSMTHVYFLFYPKGKQRDFFACLLRGIDESKSRISFDFQLGSKHTLNSTTFSLSLLSNADYKNLKLKLKLYSTKFNVYKDLRRSQSPSVS